MHKNRSFQGALRLYPASAQDKFSGTNEEIAPSFAATLRVGIRREPYNNEQQYFPRIGEYKAISRYTELVP